MNTRLPAGTMAQPSDPNALTAAAIHRLAAALEKFNEMTRDELVAIEKRLVTRIKRDGFPSRPLTEADKALFDELLRQREQGELK